MKDFDLILISGKRRESFSIKKTQNRRESAVHGKAHEHEVFIPPGKV
jgi:hypothetical protein